MAVLATPPLTSVSQYLTKTITFTGAAGLGAVGQVTVATPTGVVLVKKIVPTCMVDLASAGGGSVSLGRAASVAQLIAATTATGIDAGAYWLSNAPAALLLALPAGLQNVVAATPITIDVTTGDVTAGALRFLIEWEPMSAGAVIA